MATGLIRWFFLHAFALADVLEDPGRALHGAGKKPALASQVPLSVALFNEAFLFQDLETGHDHVVE